MTPKNIAPTTNETRMLNVLTGKQTTSEVLESMDRKTYESEYERAYAMMLEGYTTATYNGVDYWIVEPRKQWKRRVR